MLNIIYAPVFVRQYKKLDEDLKKEVKEKIELFKNKNNHGSLNVHKLHGKLKDKNGFYINYKIRIVFVWMNNTDAALLSVGSHDVYK